MSLNQTHAIDQQKVAKYGKYFGSIDFTTKNGVTRSDLQRDKLDVVVGAFTIGGHEFNITLSELDRILETGNAAKEVFIRKYTLGV